MISPVTADLDYELAQWAFTEYRTAGAAVAMAKALLLGNGVAPDLDLGVSVLQAQSTEGDVTAMHDLARCYAHGLGVRKNLDACRAWLTKAAELGSIEAMGDLVRLLACGPFQDERGARSEVLGLCFRIMNTIPEAADWVGDDLPELLAEMTESEIQTGLGMYRPALLN